MKRALMNMRDAMRPQCRNHVPVISFDTNEDGTMAVIHCKQCGFTAFVNPDSLAALLT